MRAVAVYRSGAHKAQDDAEDNPADKIVEGGRCQNKNAHVTFQQIHVHECFGYDREGGN